MRITANATLFPLGRLAVTPGALEYHAADLLACLARHAQGDWGDLCDAGKAANDRALVEGTRLLSAYNTPRGRLWIITEADRSVTTALLPDEY